MGFITCYSQLIEYHPLVVKHGWEIPLKMGIDYWENHRTNLGSHGWLLEDDSTNFWGRYCLFSDMVDLMLLLEDAIVFYESILFVFHNMHHLKFDVPQSLHFFGVKTWHLGPAEAIHVKQSMIHGEFGAAIPLISKHYRNGHYGAPHWFCMFFFFFNIYIFA